MKSIIARVVGDWTARIAGARSAIAELHEAERTLREAHTAAVQERQRLIDSPAPVAEAVAAMTTVIDGLAEQWSRNHAIGVLNSFGPGMATQRDGSVAPGTPSLPAWFHAPGLSLATLAGAFPELAKARLRAVIEGAIYTPGPPSSDRLRLLADADARVAELERQHVELVETAASFDPPIELKFLPAVAERRAEEDHKRKRAEEDAARERRIAADDADRGYVHRVPAVAVHTPRANGR